MRFFALRLAAILSLPLIAPSAFHQVSPAFAAVPASDRIAVTTSGKGPDVILIPGLASTGATRAMFDTLYQGAFASVKQAKVKRIDGSHHFIMIDQPRAFLAEVDSFRKP